MSAILVTVIGAFLGSDLAGTVSLDVPPEAETTWFGSAHARTAPEVQGRVLRFGAMRKDAITEIDQFVSYGPAGTIVVFRCRAGWPFRCATGAQWIISLPGGQSSEVRAAGVIVHRSAWFSERLIPWHPIWSGALGNVMIFAIISASITAVARRARRTHRRRCGRCPWCGYQRAHDRAEDCPECGS